MNNIFSNSLFYYMVIYLYNIEPGTLDNPELILALSTIITGVIATAVSAFVSLTNLSKTAKKNEVDLLREEITRLQARVVSLESEKQNWQNKYDTLLNQYLQVKIEKSLAEKELSLAKERIGNLETEIQDLRSQIIEIRNEKEEK